MYFRAPIKEGVVNPWMSVVLKHQKKTHTVAREEVYEFAWGCIERAGPSLQLWR